MMVIISFRGRREIPAVQALRKKKADAIAAQQKAQIQMQREQMLAQNANKLNEPIQPGTPLAAVGPKVLAGAGG